ncbi:MAG TPA: histidinol-phosphate transaminase [Chthonomonadaceae bacterium]|nr:histidinol-phosphate transaminase [Chthonomonadaceae bacterium]
MRVRINHLVNSLTRQALYETVPGYVAKEVDFPTLEEQARREYGIARLHRFDLGENAFGCTPRVREFLQSLSESDLRHYLSGYPETTGPLKACLAEINRVPAAWIALGTGVVSFISNLCHTFYEWGDRVLLPTPTFFVIEEYVLRSGALPIYMPFAYEEGFAWTERMTDQVIHQMQCLPIKMLWLCTPNNPTGQSIPSETIERVVRAAEESFTIVVVDEAYGEFTDDLPEYRSAARLLERHENLIVLRSFSKAYGLAGMRVGYAMVASKVIHDALARQIEYFPVTKLSLEMARVAAEDQGYIACTRRLTRKRLCALQAAICGIPGFECLPTCANIFLCRHKESSAAQLLEGLMRFGVLVANADIEGLRGQGWVRITCREEPDNRFLLSALKKYSAQGMGSQAAPR